jgi:hypothetical protein
VFTNVLPGFYVFRYIFVLEQNDENSLHSNSEVLTAILLNIQFFCHVTLCRFIHADVSKDRSAFETSVALPIDTRIRYAVDLPGFEYQYR